MRTLPSTAAPRTRLRVASLKGAVLMYSSASRCFGVAAERNSNGQLQKENKIKMEIKGRKQSFFGIFKLTTLFRGATLRIPCDIVVDPEPTLLIFSVLQPVRCKLRRP